MEALRQMLAPWYLEIKAIHLTAVAAWIWSTSVAFIYYLVPAFQAWRRSPNDPAVLTLRNWVMDRFDRGVVIEHTMFPIIMTTGPLLYWIGGWDTRATWLTLKLLIVFGLFLPIEIFDYHLSHFAGNKRNAFARGGEAEHERKLHQHWWFLLATTPAIIFFALLVLLLAFSKARLAA